MVNIKFVGFQGHEDIPDNYELLDIQEEISCALESDQVFSLMSEPSMLSRWFYEFTSIDSRPGGKVTFLTDSGNQSEAICTSFSPGKEIVLLSDLFGEYSARLISKKDGTKLHVRFRILTDNLNGVTKILKNFIENLQDIVSI